MPFVLCREFSPWRAAALGALLVVTGLCGGCRSASSVAEAQGQGGAKLKLALNGFSPITGTPFLFAEANVVNVEEGFFERLESSSFGSYDKKHGQIRNYVFLQPTTLTNQWLLPHSNFLFVTMLELPLRPPVSPNDRGKEKDAPPPKPTQLLYYELVKADTNGSKIFEVTDRKTIALSDVSGSGYQELINDVDRVLHRAMNNDDELLVIYQAGEKYHATKISLAKRQITETKELAPLPQIQPLS